MQAEEEEQSLGWPTSTFSFIPNERGCSSGMHEHLVQFAFLARWLSFLFVRLQEIKAKSFRSTWKPKLLVRWTRRTGRLLKRRPKTSAGFSFQPCQSRGCQLIHHWAPARATLPDAAVCSFKDDYILEGGENCGLWSFIYIWVMTL